MNKNQKKNSKKSNTDSARYESRLNTSSVKLPTQNLSHRKNDKIPGNLGQNNPNMPPLFGFNWREFQYLQNVLNDDNGSIREDAGIECASLTTISTATITKSLVIVGEEPISPLHKLRYLMGLPSFICEEAIEYEAEPEEKPEKPTVDMRDMTLAMRRAENYLQQHRISQFFQFLMCHLTAAKSDRPIDFLIGLLDECLIYRSGLGAPPLLYDPQHLEQLFYKMDTMKTNFIDFDQYRTGMLTLGIVNFCKRPHLSPNNMICKDYFIAEAVRCLTSMLDEMIEKRSDSGKKNASNVATPPPSSVTLKSK